MNDKLKEIRERHLLECKIDFRTHTNPDIDDLVYQLFEDRASLLKMVDAQEAKLDAVRGVIQQNDDWESSTKETVRNIKQLLSGDLQNEILDIPQHLRRDNAAYDSEYVPRHKLTLAEAMTHERNELIQKQHEEIESLKTQSQEGWDKYKELRKEIANNRYPELTAMVNAESVMGSQSVLITKLQQELAESNDAMSQAQWRFEQAEAQLVRVLEWHEVSCYDELPFVIDELREGETALNGEDNAK